MKKIKNISEERLEVSFNFWTYYFSKDKVVFIKDDLYEHIKELLPLAFDFRPKVKKGEAVPTVEKKKTPPVFGNIESAGTEDMKITQAGHQSPTFGQVDQTPAAGQTDRDGVGWYGEGIEVEGTGKTFK